MLQPIKIAHIKGEIYDPTSAAACHAKPQPDTITISCMNATRLMLSPDQISPLTKISADNLCPACVEIMLHYCVEMAKEITEEV